MHFSCEVIGVCYKWYQSKRLQHWRLLGIVMQKGSRGMMLVGIISGMILIKLVVYYN